MKRSITFFALTSAVLISPGGFAADYPNKMEGKAATACKLEADVVFARKIEMADQYLTPDFVDHTVRVRTTSRASFKEALAKLPRPSAPASGCGIVKIVLQQGDYVVFVRETQVPDPNDNTKRVPGTYFDVFRFEGDKIAEHWSS